MDRIEIFAILICGGFLALGFGMMGLGIQKIESMESGGLMLGGAIIAVVSCAFSTVVGLSLRWRRENEH